MAARTAAERAAHGKLKWTAHRRARESAAMAQAAVQAAAQATAQPVAQASAVESAGAHVTPALALEPADGEPACQCDSGACSRASLAAVLAGHGKLRDKILQVAAAEEDPFKDPFGEKAKPPAENEPSPSDAPKELAPAEPTPAQTPSQTPDMPAEPALPERDGADDMRAVDELPGPDSQETNTNRPADTRTTCEEDKKECRKAWQTLRDKHLDDIELSIAVTGAEGRDFPCECTLGDERFEPRCWGETIYTWKASSLCHKPLYFEEVALERYGHSWNPVMQPFISGAHFFATIPLLPYKMELNLPNECMYALGYYRPGNCAPYLLDPFPLDLGAALKEAGFIAGAVAIIP